MLASGSVGRGAEHRPAEAAELRWLALLVLVALIVSGVAPRDRLTWLLESSWVLVGLPLVIATRQRFPLTRLLSRLLAFHALFLLVGAYYTYEHVPLGNWLRDAFHLQRNHYDRIGHFLQGFVPALLVREWLLRCSPLAPGPLLTSLVTAVCVAFSACFELLEWWAALALGAQADAYLATQGDPWDTQWDMFLALCGALLAQAVLSRWHDRQIAALIAGNPTA